MVLNVARALHRSKVKLSAPVYLVLWTGEEQGLWGSRKLSQKWREEEVDLQLMIHADMVSSSSLRSDAPLTRACRLRTASPANLCNSRFRIASSPRKRDICSGTSRCFTRPS